MLAMTAQTQRKSPKRHLLETMKRNAYLAHKIGATGAGKPLSRQNPRFKPPAKCADNVDTMLSACIMLGALLVIMVAITTVSGDSTAAYKWHISLFGNGDDF